MMPITTGQAAASFLKYLAEPAARSLALGCLAAIGLAAFRVKRVPLRLLVWTTTLYAALAMPFLGALLPRMTVHIPAQATSSLQSVEHSFAQSFRRGDTTTMARANVEREAPRQLGQATPQPFLRQGTRDPSKLRASVSYTESAVAANPIANGARGDMTTMASANAVREAARQLRQTTPQPFLRQGTRDPSKL
ncbi:MAG: hypothetical protein ACRD4A_11155, partial [Candidatus Acidiferrales bacterium]